MVRFLSVFCPYCKTQLPVKVHYKNDGYFFTWCGRCGKGVYVYKQKAIDERKK